MSQDITKPTSPQKEQPENNPSGETPAEVDPIQTALTDSSQRGLPVEIDFDDLPEPLPELDEGPPPAPVDDIQDVLHQAVLTGAPSEVDFEELPEPLPELDEGPRPGPVDDIQDALFGAVRSGARPEVEFDELPEPGPPPGAQKVISFKQPDTVPTPPPAPARPARPILSTESLPPPEFPTPDPVPRLADTWLILITFIVFRLLTLGLLRPGGFIRDWSDFDTYYGLAALSDYGLYPFWHFWLEWPPLVPWLAVGAYRLSLLLPPWPDDPRLFFILIMGSLFLLFEVGNFILIFHLARRLFSLPTTINRVLWLYAGLFPPVYAMLGFFDGIALFFMLLTLELLLRDRRTASAIALGAGIMVKIIPVLMLPVALRRLWQLYRDDRRAAWTELGLYAVITGLTVIVLLAPFLIRGPQWVRASAQSMIERSSWETVWAVAEGYYGFGRVGGDRLKTLPQMQAAGETFTIHQPDVPDWLNVLLKLAPLAFIAGYGFALTRPADYRHPRPVMALAGLTVAIFMLATKGYSPQFLVYLLPFILLFFPNGRGLTYALLLTALNILEQPVYFVLLPREQWLLIFIVAVRFGLVALLALEFVLILWPQPRWQPLQERLPQALLVLALLSGVIMLPIMAQAYRADQQAHSVTGTFAGFIKQQTRQLKAIQPGPAGKPRLLLSDQSTYRQLYPYLHPEFDLQLSDGAAKDYPGAPRIIDLLNGLDTLWVLPTGPNSETLSRAVSGRGKALASFDFEGLGTASLYGLQANNTPLIAPARYSTGIELLGHEVKKERNAVDVTLYWRALNPQNQSYTVFAQLLNADGELVNTHDGIPVNGTAPTDTWPAGAVQADSHRIELPSSLPPGQYTLITGLYNQFGDRLSGINPEGVTFLNEAVPLEVISLP